MTLTVRDLVQEFASLRGLPIPAAVVGATDKNATQYKAIIQAVVRKCLQYRWEGQKVLGSWTAVATSDQGVLSTLLAPSGGYGGLVKNTMWCTSRKIPVLGPISDQEYATQQALSLVGPPYKFWLAQEHIYLTPVPTAGETFSAVYQTLFGYAASGVPQENITADENTFLFPDEVMIKGFEAFWKKQKGEDYAEDMVEFIGLIARAKADKGMPTFQLDSPAETVGPRIYIPIGDWPT